MMVTLEIDEQNEIVKEYESLSELINDVISYRFSSVLPIIKSGAVTLGFNGHTWEIHPTGLHIR